MKYRSANAQSEGVAPSGFERQKILIVDEGNEDLAALGKMFKKELSDIEILTCQDPAQVVDLLRKTKVSVALIDVQMPKMDGLELCKEIKAHAEIQSVHIILISSHESDSEMKTRAFSFGADDFITRPLYTAELFGRVNVALRLCQAESMLQQKASEAEAEASKFSHLIEESLNEIYVFDAYTYRFYEVNRGAQENTGYRVEELREMTYLDINYEMTEEKFLEITEPLRHGVEYNIRFETVHRRKDGTEYPVEIHFQLMVDKKLVFVAISIDITERKLAESKMRENEERYRLLFENMTGAFALHELIYDEAGNGVDYRFLQVNPAFQKLTGFKADDIIGRTVVDVMPGTESEWIEIYSQVVKTGEPIEFERYSAVLKKHFHIRAFRTRPNHFATVFDDITIRKKSAEELEQYRDHLEEMVVERTSDLEKKSRELRTIVHAMAGRENRMAELKKIIKDLQARLEEARMKPVENQRHETDTDQEDAGASS